MARRTERNMVKEADPIKDRPAALTFEAVVGEKGDGAYLTKTTEASGEPVLSNSGFRYVMTRGSTFRLYRIYKAATDEDAVHLAKKTAISDNLATPVLWKAQYRNREKQLVYCFHCLLY